METKRLIKLFILSAFLITGCHLNDIEPTDGIPDDGDGISDNGDDIFVIVDPNNDELADPKDDELVDPQKMVMYALCPMATINDGKVRLKWGPVMRDDMLRPYEIVDPDYIEIFISDNEMSDFRQHIVLENGGSYSYTIDNLQNGKPYYFYAVSKKKGFKPLYSGTIMTVPNKRGEIKTLLKSDLFTLGCVSIAKEINKTAYVNNRYTWDAGSYIAMATSVLISNMDGTANELVATNGYQPCWSPQNDRIALMTEKRYWPSISLYDYKTKSIKQLTKDDERCFAPDFSPNGELLLYQSTKNTSDEFDTNIWLINLKTGETWQVTDISGLSLHTAEYPRWIDNERFLFHGKYPNEKSQLYESSVSTKQAKKVFESKWSDYAPSISPDQKNIAFISSRSSTNQIWLFNINSQTFTQITGYSLNETCEPGGCKIEWWDDSTITYTVNGDRLIRQKIK